MGSGLVPEFVPEQNQYYPAATNYYYYTGTEQHMDGQHSYLGLDAQGLQFSGLQTESSPYAYSPATYEYVESGYNPYNPYIPGAVMGLDGQYIGNQQYFNATSFQRAVSPSPYIPPLGFQSSSDMVHYTSPDQFSLGPTGGKYTPPLSYVSATPSLQNQAFDSFQSSPQIPLAVGPMDGSVVNAVPTMHGALTSSIAPYMIQGTEHLLHGGVQSGRVRAKSVVPGNSSIANLGPTARAGDRLRPRTQLNDIFNKNIVEQNVGPRMSRLHAQVSSPVVSKPNPTTEARGNSDVNAIVHPDQYNRDDFPVEYANAKFFVIKSYIEDDVHKSIKYNVWSSTSSGNKKLDYAYAEAQNDKSKKCPVFLFFSVNASGHFCGVAEMTGPVDFHKDMDFWLQDKWTGSFPVRWHIIKDVPNSSLRHIILVNNEHRPVTSSRDTQEIQYLPGTSMLAIFKNSSMTTSILDDFMYFEDRQKIMQEERSRFLPRISNPTSFLPLSVKVDSATNRPTSTNGAHVGGTVIQVPAPNPNNKEPRPESSEKANSTVDKDLKAKEKQQNQSESSNGMRADDQVNQDGKTSGKQTENSANCKDPGVLGSSQDQSDEKPETAADSRDMSPVASTALPLESVNGETDATDLVTIGSMQIKINTTSNSTGSLTIGSVPVDLNRLKI